MVDIQIEQGGDRNRCPSSTGSRHGGEIGAIGQAGQAVMHGDMDHAFFYLAPFGYILDKSDQIARLIAFDRRYRRFDDPHRADVPSLCSTLRSTLNTSRRRITMRSCWAKTAASRSGKISRSIEPMASVYRLSARCRCRLIIEHMNGHRRACP
ncbi:hypothetical protein VXQ18_07465 [Brucella abortus]|nr:hypothetical protein [Brucella abortus]